MLKKNVHSTLDIYINCPKLGNSNGHVITSRSTLSLSENNFGVVSCCYLKSGGTNLLGTGNRDDKQFSAFSGLRIR